MRARDMAAACGLPPKLAYTTKETAGYVGVPYTTLLAEIHAGRLKCFLPNGRERGWVIRPEDVDRWIKDGTHAMEA